MPNQKLNFLKSGSLRQILFLSLVIFSISSTSSVMGQQINLDLVSSEQILTPGETFEVDLQILNPEQQSIRGLQHAVSWNSAVLQLLDIEIPGDLAGSPVPQILVWNAPQPAGSGGDSGCAQWWDGSGDEALSLGLVFESAIADSSIPLSKLYFRVVGNAANGETILSTPEADLSCGWLGSLVTNDAGAIIPTVTDTEEITISDVPRPTELLCGEASSICYLSWSEPIAYDQVKVIRNGILIGEINSGEGQFEDPDGVIGSIREYSVQGILNGVESPLSNCSISVDGEVEPPVGLTCNQSGSGVLLTWSNPLPFSQLEIIRQGVSIEILSEGSSSFLDGSPVSGVNLAYQIRGTIGGSVATSEECQIFLPIPEVLFIRGDVNSDGQLNLVDPITTLQYLFVAGEMPCASAADFNDDSSLDLSDAINLLAFLFTGGGSPEAPFPLAGFDPVPDSLGCAQPCSDSTCGGGILGDECISAIEISLGDTFFDTTSMTDSPDEYSNIDCDTTFLGLMLSDIWFDFTATNTGTVTLSLCDKVVTFDTDLVVYSGGCGQLVQEACNGDGFDENGIACPFLTSRISGFPVTEGEQYFIRVGGFAALSTGGVESGPGILSITSD